MWEPPEEQQPPNPGAVEYASYEEAFTYENISSRARVLFGQYITMNFVLAEEEDERSIFVEFGNLWNESNGLETGWKFHVSIDEDDEANLARGFELVRDILIRHEVSGFKVVAQGQKMVVEGDAHQRGKQMTIYQYLDPEKDWEAIIQEITQTLMDNNINPSYEPPSDHLIRGSNYVYYRKDATITGKYQPATEEKGERNPVFDAFNIQVANQHPVREWHRETAAHGYRH